MRVDSHTLLIFDVAGARAFSTTFQCLTLVTFPMNSETIPVNTGPPRTTWTPEPPLHNETKPVVLPCLSPFSTVPELIYHLKSSFCDRDFSRIEEILTNREAQLCTEIQTLKRERDSADKHLNQVLLEKFKMERQSVELKKEMEDLMAEKAEAVANSKAIGMKYRELVCRVLRLEEKFSKKLDVDVTVIQNMAEDMEKEHTDVVGVNSNGNGNSREKDPLPANLAGEERAPTYLSVCTANMVLGRPGPSNAVHIIGSDEEMRGSNLAFPRKMKSEDMMESSAPLTKRKRSLNETDNGDGSSFGTQKTKTTQELDREENNSMPPEATEAFVKRSDVKVEEKWHSRLSLRKYILVEIPDVTSDSDDDLTSDKNMELLFKKFEEARSILSENDLRSSFENNPELCMEGVCALYRQQINGLFFSKNPGLSTDDKIRVAAYGEYLIDGDAENKLRKAVADVSSKYQDECKRLATTYCHQLHQIYVSKEDHLFCPGAIILS